MRFLLLTALVAAYGVLCSAQEIIPTAVQPVTVFEAGNFIHILTAQWDGDFNGTQGEGESPATWLTVEKGTYNKVMETSFPWAWVIAGRPAVDTATGSLIISVGDTVGVYSLATHERTAVLSETQAFGLGVSGDGQRVYATRRLGFDAEGVVEMYTVGSTSEPIPLAVGINPQQNKTFRTSSNIVGLAVVCEGVFGHNNGTLDVWSALMMGYTRTSIPVGDTPNYLVIDGDFVYVACNNSHTIVKVNLITLAAVDTFEVGTSGYNGPRELVVQNDFVLATTYNGDIRVFNKNTGALLHTVTCSYKPEGFAFVGDRLFVTRQMKTTEYKPETGVAVYTIDQITSVAEEASRSNAHSAIFAVNSTLQLPMLEGAGTLVATDMNGKQFDLAIADHATMRVDLSALPTGVYVITDGKTNIVVGK